MLRMLGRRNLSAHVHLPIAVRLELIRSFSSTNSTFTSTTTAEPKVKPNPLAAKSRAVAQLERVAELYKEVSPVNSKIQKAAIIAKYPDLRDLLEFLAKYMDSGNAVVGDQSPATLIDLFDMLARRQFTGNGAKCRCLTFLVNEGIVGFGEIDSPELLDIFFRLLDRNLTAGFGANTLKMVPWEGVAQNEPASNKATTAKSKAAAATSKATSTPSKPLEGTAPARVFDLNSFSCALSMSIHPPFNELFDGKEARYMASRKLDGVRCLTFVDVLVPDEGDPVIGDIQFLSRKGNQFTSLSRLEDQLRELKQWPGLRDFLARDPSVVSEQPGGEVKRLVLDGEVCVMRPMTEKEYGAQSAEHDDGTTAADQLWIDDGLTEDFQATVSRVKRKYETIEHPAYFVFDVLSWAEFAAKGPVASPGLGRKFSERLEDIMAVTSFLADQERPLIRALVQQEVTTREHLDRMVERAANQGWEGLILRADTTYKGKRSKDLYKLKEWQDKEYTVVSAHNNTMRFAVNGVFDEREACANVIIHHKGHPVSVGSGFSADQRLRFGQDHSLIVGKQITVEYFGESEALDRPGVMSLRFPRIKAVWEGKRDI